MKGCYLLHFDKPISDRHTTQHYLGYSNDIPSRINQHRQGHGSRLCEVAKERKIDFVIAQTWIGSDRQLEAKLKSRKNSPQLCPFCTFKW